MPRSDKSATQVNNRFSKGHIRTVIEWLVALAAYAYLVYRLVTFDRYDAFAAVFVSSGAKEWVCLILMVMLMPFNLGLEAGKWRELLRELHPVGWREAMRQVLYGQQAAFVTPYRLGDIPARVMRLNDGRHWKQGIVLGLYGGIIQTVIIIVCGVVPAFIFLHQTALPYVRLIGAAAAVALFVPFVLQYKSLPRSVRLTGRQLFRTMGWSAARYTCWTIQFALTMVWAGVSLSFADMAILIPTYYLLVTVTPNIPVADAGIRGGWAVFTFGFYGVDAPTAALAAVAMWIVNNLLSVALFLPMRSATKERGY